MSDISLLENRGACETLGSSSVPATLDNLLHEPADSESGVRSRHGRNRPAESLTRSDHISFSLFFFAVQTLSEIVTLIFFVL